MRRAPSSAASASGPIAEVRPARAWTSLALGLILFGLPLLLLWPGPAVWRTDVLAAPDQEAATHIWGLWAALREGQPLFIHSTLLGWPAGVRLVLVDAANLPAFALGQALGGPAAGYNSVLYFGLVLQGVAGALLARTVGGAPWLGAIAAMACPTLLSNAADGMTEGFAVGWVGVQLAALLRALRGDGKGWALLAVLGLALAWYGGPYNGLFAALIDAVVGLSALIAARMRPADLRVVAARLGSIAAGAALLISPLAYGILFLRDAELPGSEVRAGLPKIVNNPLIFRGGVQTGADLLDPLLPGALTGGEAPISHTAYLGLAAVLIAALMVARDRRRWRWLAGAACFCALSLGPYLYLRGVALNVGGHALLGPAGVLTLILPPLGRLTRWYRAGAVATLLLAPLVSLAGKGRPLRGLVLGVALVADALLAAPLAWPLHATPLPESAPYAALQGEGAILELPRNTTGEPPPGGWRDLTALAQTLHGRPVPGTIMRLPTPPGAAEHTQSVQGLLRTGGWPAQDRERVLSDGYRWLAIYLDRAPLTERMRANLNACLGEPLAEGKALVLWSLVASAPPRDCLPARAPDNAAQPPSSD